MDKGRAVIIYAGDDLSASLTRNLAEDYKLILSARSAKKLEAIAAETEAETVLLDAMDRHALGGLVDAPP